MVTIFVVKTIFLTLDGFFGPYITPLLIKLGLPLSEEFFIPGLGVIATIILIFVVGVVTTNYFGKKLWNTGEKIVKYIPGIGIVYNAAKQIIDTFSISDTAAFSKVVLFEYPRRGTWCYAFITGRATGEAEYRTAANLVNVFVPTTPNPTSGYLLLVPKNDLIELSMSIEDGIKMVVSGGILTPEYHALTQKENDMEFKPEIIEYKVDKTKLTELAKGHNGMIKVVVDLGSRRMAAGAKWHSDLKLILEESGSKSSDLLGAKLYLDDKSISFVSQINIGHQYSTNDEVTDQSAKDTIESIIREQLT